MIGAAGAAGPASLPSSSASFASPYASSTGAAADASATEAASTPDAATTAGNNTPASSPPTSNAAAKPQRADGQNERATAANPTDKPADFAALLARTGEGTASAATPASPPATGDKSADKTATEGGSETSPAPTSTLPDQILALLGGTWTTPASATPQPATQPTQSAGGESAASSTSAIAARPAFSNVAAFPAAAMPMAASGNPAPAEASGVAAVIDANTANGAPDDASVPVAGGDANAALPVFPNVAPTTSVGPEARSVALAAPVNVPVDPQQGFDDGFGARLVWMAEQRLGHAEIRLNPEHLGPIEVRVQVDGTQVNAEFNSTHASVRQSIEASMPRLREMLGQQGLQLNHADVGQRHAGSQSGQRPQENAELGPDSNGSMGKAAAVGALRSRGLLDEYA